MKALHYLLLLVIALCISVPPVVAEERAIPSYRLQVRLEPASHHLEAEAWIPHPPSARFHLYKGFTVRSVEIAGKPVQFHTEQAATPESNVSGVDTTVEYSSLPGKLHIRFSGEMTEEIARVNQIAPDLVELAVYSAWYPAFDGLRSFSFEADVDMPKGFFLTMNARKDRQREKQNRVLTHWTSYTAESDMALFAAPKMIAVHRQSNAMQIEIDYTNLPKDIIERKAEALAQGVRRLTGLYGPPQTSGIVQLIYTPRKNWGYSRIPLIIVSEQRAAMTLGTEFGEAKDFRDNAHELAHFWWRIADPHTSDDWINEGLAEYAAFRLAQEQFGTPFANSRMLTYKSALLRNKTTDAIAETPNNSPDREINRYDRAPLMMIEAQQRFGADAVDRMLSSLYRRTATRQDATTAIFLEEARKCIGSEGEAFFREKLYAKPSLLSAQ